MAFVPQDGKCAQSSRFFAIRQRSSGKYLPYSLTKNTHSQPVSMAISVPRLFDSQKGAALALASWLKGRAVVDYDENGVDLPVRYEGAEERSHDDMEIVVLDMSLSEETGR